MNSFLGIMLVIAIIILAPFITIWSVNTIFLLTIPYTVNTWLATFWLSALFTAGAYRGKN